MEISHSGDSVDPRTLTGGAREERRQKLNHQRGNEGVPRGTRGEVLSYFNFRLWLMLRAGALRLIDSRSRALRFEPSENAFNNRGC